MRENWREQSASRPHIARVRRVTEASDVQTMIQPSAPEDLPEIPVVDCGAGGPFRLAELMPAGMADMLDAARRLYTRPLLGLIDRRSQAWLARNKSPYAPEIERIAAFAGRPGVRALNISYEWACTTGARDGRLCRVLDWPFKGLGRGVAVARHTGQAGTWYNVTWPGFVGVLTALKPGKFAAALNQAPLRRRTGLLACDWLIDRVRVDRSIDPPSTHILRQAFETCPDFDSALAFLGSQPMALPALFVLAGVKGEVAIIERQEQDAIIHRGPGAIANHWLNPDWRGRPRGEESQGRRQMLLDRIEGHALEPDFSWLVPPILNRRTRLATFLDAVKGEMAILGLEQSGRSAVPATRILRLSGLLP